MAKTPKTLAAKAQKPASVTELAPPASTEGHKAFSFGGLSLVITPAAALPADATSQRAARATVLPFPELFDNMSVGSHFYLPNEFWEKRKADPANKIAAKTDMNTTYIKGKVRTAFDKWKKAKEDRATLRLVAYTRPNGISPADDPSFPTDPRPGHSIYIVQDK